MKDDFIYLDYAAGTPICQEVIENSLRFANKYHYNPSALYTPARLVARRLEDCRLKLANLLSVKATDLIFTAGATEANRLVISALKRTYPQARIAGLQIDHVSWRKNVDVLLPVNKVSGQLEEQTILSLDDDICCLGLSGVNSELGIIQSASKIKAALKRLRHKRLQAGNTLPLWLHVDASQMFLVDRSQPQSWGADSLLLNGGKMYSFKQSALLYLRPGLSWEGSWEAGGQERGIRPGGESLFTCHRACECSPMGRKQKIRSLQAISSFKRVL